MEPFQPRDTAFRAGGHRCDVPKIDEDSAFRQAEPVSHCGFDDGEVWRAEEIQSGERLYGSIACTRRYKRDRSGVACKGEVQRALSPEERLLGSEEGRLNQNKDAKVYVLPLQLFSRIRELLKRELLVKFLERFRVRCLEPHGDLKLASQKAAKAQAPVPYERWMTLYDHSLEGLNAKGDLRVIIRRNGSEIEEAAAVV